MRYKRIDKKTERKMISLIKMGLGYTAVGERFGYSGEFVRKVCRRYHVPSSRKSGQKGIGYDYF